MEKDIDEKINLLDSMTVLLKKLKQDSAIVNNELILIDIQKILNAIIISSNSEKSEEKYEIFYNAIDIYIRDFLSATKCIDTISKENFQKIGDSLKSAYAQTCSELVDVNNSEMSRHICFRTFDLLCLPVISNFLKGNCHNLIQSHVANLLYELLEIIEKLSSIARFKKDDLEKYEPLLHLLLEYTDTAITKDNINQESFIEKILYIIWNLVDKTVLVPHFINIGSVLYFTRWLQIENASLETHRACLSIFHNVARHDQGAEALNAADGIRILQNFKHHILDPEDGTIHEEMNLLYWMAMALLTEPKDNKNDMETIGKVLDQLIQITVTAALLDDPSLTGFHISEPLVVLTRLCIHDNALHYIMKECHIDNADNSKVNFFCSLAIRFRNALNADNELNQITLTALMNIIWSISFHPEYQTELESNSEFLMAVKSLANDEELKALAQPYVPKHMGSVKKASDGILWNLETTSKVKSLEGAASEGASEIKGSQVATEQLKVMMSYSHADGAFCRELVNALEKDTRIKIWVDFNHCRTEDLWGEIGEAIEQADVVLFLMSKDYQDSKSCRQEVMYTKDSLKKRFIPIYVQRDFVATSWLGVRIVGPQYIRFGKKSFDESLRELIKLLIDDRTENKNEGNKLLTTVAKTDIKLTLQKSNTNSNSSSKPVNQWNSKDVSDWLNLKNIRQELIDIFHFQNGNELLLYGRCVHSNIESEYSDIRERYVKRYGTNIYRDEFVRLVAAIDQLGESKSSSTKRSKTCLIM